MQARTTTPHSVAYLEPFRQIGDPMADQAINEIFLLQDNAGFQKQLNKLQYNADLSKEDYSGFPLPSRANVEVLFNSVQLSAPADMQKISTAASVFALYGPEINMILLCRSLPLCYSCWRGAKVLHQTGRLLVHDGSMESYTRRLMETAQFVMHVLEPDAFSPKGKAIVSALKVRLIHSAIRQGLLKTGWDTKNYGVPINQEDLAGTLLSFSNCIIDGLKQINIHLNPAEIDSLMYVWSIAGKMVGLKDELICTTYDEADILMKDILAHQSGPSEQGTHLTAGCIDFMQHVLPGNRHNQLAPVLIRFFVGDEVANMLQVPKEPKSVENSAIRFLKSFVHIQEEAEHHSIFMKNIAVSFSRHLMQGFFNLYNEGRQNIFEIPSSVSDNWHPIKVTKRIPQVKTVDEAVHYMRLLTQHFKEENNPLGYFAAVYELVTRRVAESVKKKEFNNNEVLEKVDVAFASLYFEAINNYFMKQPARKPWQVSFDAVTDPDPVVDQHIFMACNAHIGYDLIVTVAEAFPGEAIYAFEDDFNYMNSLFSGMYSQMNADIGEIWTPFGGFMKLFGHEMEKLEGFIMTKERHLSWEKAVKLATTPANDYPAALKNLEDEVEKSGLQIYNPPAPVKAILKRISRAEKGSVADRIDIMLQTNLIKGEKVKS